MDERRWGKRSFFGKPSRANASSNWRGRSPERNVTRRNNNSGKRAYVPPHLRMGVFAPGFGRAGPVTYRRTSPPPSAAAAAAPAPARNVTRRNTKPSMINITNERLDRITDYNAAGCTFTDGNKVLLGYQHRNGTLKFGGLGGKRETYDENYLETILREVIEELFFNPTPKSKVDIIFTIIHRITATIRPKYVFKSNRYVLCVFTLNQLNEILAIIKASGLESPYYDTMPDNIDDLITKRKVTERNAHRYEVSLLNMYNISTKRGDYGGNSLKSKISGYDWKNIERVSELNRNILR